MELSVLLQHTQYALPVAATFIIAILVFVVGIKRAEPSFSHLSNVGDPERKAQTKRKTKSKDKRAANGQVTTEKSPSKKSVNVKETTTSKKSSKSVDDAVDNKHKERKQQDDNKTSNKNQDTKSAKENKVEQVKNKKNLKNLMQEKPVDYDEGDWEQAYSRKEKLKKKREEETTPSKKSKKSKKTELINDAGNNKEQEKPEIKDKMVKETENKELKEKDSMEVIFTPLSNEEFEKLEEVAKIEEVVPVKQSPKVEKVEKEEKKSGKGKKAKKNAEVDTTKSVPEAPLKQEKKVIDEVADVVVKIEPIETIVIEKSEEKTGVVVFDELGDVWKEAKPPKKSKKRTRKDN